MLNVRVASTARIASLIFRVNVGSSPRSRVLISCCVIVDPPCVMRPLALLIWTARMMPRDVDAGIGPERLVLDRHGRVLHPLRDGVDGDEVPSLVGERVEKVLAAAVVDVGRERDRNRGEIARGGQVGSEVAEGRGRRDSDEGDAGEHDRGEDPGERADRPRRADPPRQASACAIREAIGTVSPARSDPLDGHLAV